MSEIQKWADSAMFAAEPLKADEGPRVYVLTATPDPLGAIAAACKMYKGQVVRNLAADVTREEREEYLADVRRTKLKAPFEFVKFHFLVDNVTRSLTHQMVRQRTAVYAQESLRFAVKEDMADGVALPPSIAGTSGQEPLGAEDSQREYWRNIWDQAVRDISDAYLHLVNDGMPAEDARGLLPHNITTRLHYSTDLRALGDHAGNRLCTQAQFEWRALWAEFVRAISAHCSCSQPERFHGPRCDNWQFVMIANTFRPVCFLTGQCEFRANFDRHCSIRQDVDSLGSRRIPAEEWDQHIDARRWLSDPTAARRREP